jgi:hypothetical protein
MTDIFVVGVLSFCRTSGGGRPRKSISNARRRCGRQRELSAVSAATNRKRRSDARQLRSIAGSTPSGASRNQWRHDIAVRPGNVMAVSRGDDLDSPGKPNGTDQTGRRLRSSSLGSAEAVNIKVIRSQALGISFTLRPMR